MSHRPFRVLIATYPFGRTGARPRELLEQAGCELLLNPLGRRLKAGEVKDLIVDVDAVVAGTEPYTPDILQAASRLRLISRVGIGLDNVDLAYCREHGIGVAYTPDAPADAVAELTVANIINLFRHVHESDRSVREQAWNRLMGLLVRDGVVGIIGLGRIGSRVARLLAPFSPAILAYDINPRVQGTLLPGVTWCGVDRLIAESDLVTLHIPLNERNRHFIGRAAIGRMRTGAMLVNTSRGGIVDEEALIDALNQRHLGGAALDVFEQEPYEGPLSSMSNVILTAHIGASTRTSRYLMELGAAEEVLRFLAGNPFLHDAAADAGASGPAG